MTHPDTNPVTMSAPMSQGASDAVVSVVVLACGLTTAALLTPYNLQAGSAWASGTVRHSRSWEEFLLVNICALVLPPVVIVLGILRRPASEFGISTTEPGTGKWAWLLFFGMLPLMIGASLRTEFQQYYPMFQQAAWDVRALLYHELTYGAYLLCWEGFYRGFLTFGLASRFGNTAAVVIQALLFGIMHIGKPIPEVIGSFIAGIILGVLALRSRSFLPCFWLHWACSAGFDLLIIRTKPGGLF